VDIGSYSKRSTPTKYHVRVGAAFGCIMIDAVADAENRTRVPYAGGGFILCFYT
jgi:hypothetical protein